MGEAVGIDAEVRAEKHGKETGAIIANIKNLGINMNNGFSRGEKRFDKIDKELKTINDNAVVEKLKVSELFTWYEDQKEMKKFMFKEAFKKFIPAITKALIIISAVSGVGYACLR